MGYAGIFMMLTTKKTEKIHSDYSLMRLNEEVLEKTSESAKITKEFNSKRTDIQKQFNTAGNFQSRDDVDYDITQSSKRASDGKYYYTNEDGSFYMPDGKNKVEVNREAEIAALDEEMQDLLADIKEEEDRLTAKKSREETVNKMLETEVSTYQTMLQNNIKEAHTFGVQ